MKLFFVTLGLVNGHGRIIEPPGRSSLHRFPNDNEIDQSRVEPNYNDNGLFCGGFQVQVNNGYKCGICGDNWAENRPRANELGGKYGKSGIIPRSYKQGDIVDITIQLTAHHKGWMSFKICPQSAHDETEDEECFALADSVVKFTDMEEKWDVTEKSGDTFYHNTIQLPEDLTCEHCVMQWRYHTGNSWGCDAAGLCGIGEGMQEEFYGCADIKIEPLNGPRTTTAVTSRLTTTARLTSKTSSESPLPTTEEMETTEEATTSTEIVTTTETSGSLENFCENKDNGMYSHPNDCGKFMHCANNVTFIKDCPSGLYFNNIGKYCDYPSNVSCTV